MTQQGIVWVLLLCTGVALGQQMTNEDATEFTVGFDPSTVYTTSVDYTDGVASLQGYAAWDNSTQTARPAVVILPDWDGIGPYEQWRAHLLATLGYTALVADLYSTEVQQGPSLPIDQRQANSRALQSDPELYVGRIHAALDAVRGLEVVDDTRLAAIGYCLGGAGLIHLHRSYPNNTDGLLGVAGFHSGLPSAFANEPEPNNPIRAIFFNGYNDNGSGPEEIAEFEATLNATNASWSVVQLGQTVHAFTEPTMDITATNTPSSNSGYNPDSDILSWWTLRGFLRDIFGIGGAGNSYTEQVTPGEELSAS